VVPLVLIVKYREILPQINHPFCSSFKCVIIYCFAAESTTSLFEHAVTNIRPNGD